ncbi:hypothetical protein MT409_01295 [Mammaliicoccus sciuri]|uniref:hypothetical protein n=1 Tax=Mammaliicoccus sciuri TaxID=1296 RepID=UPI001FB2EA96|nr:hypothetical protein [Mammaliicoccus sciuri]MCJ1757929.1 hypothetical protein [Mammaliicoccus sciuri]
MKFVIAEVAFFEKLGYNTRYWRKNKDGSKTICHLEYAEILAHDLDKNENVQIVDASEAQDIMATDEWAWEEE